MHQMHLDEEQIQRALHHELGRAEPELNQHVSICAECRSRLLEAQREEEWMLDRLGSADHPIPGVSASSIISSAHTGAGRGAWPRIAAGVLLALGLAGVAYAAPGSPLRAAFKGLRNLVQGFSERAPAPPAPLPLPESQGGIALLPGVRLTIDIVPSITADTAVVSLTDGNEVVIRVQGGPATFNSDAEHLVIRHSGSAATFEILIPRKASWVSIRAGSGQLWLKSRSRVLSQVSPGGAGRYVLPLSQKLGSPAP
jgi:hypothetical protein